MKTDTLAQTRPHGAMSLHEVVREDAIRAIAVMRQGFCVKGYDEERTRSDVSAIVWPRAVECMAQPLKAQ